jgi:hypothetical protein
MNGSLHAPAALPSGKEFSAPIRQETRFAPQPCGRGDGENNAPCSECLTDKRQSTCETLESFLVAE